MPMTTGNTLDDALLSVGVVVGVWVFYKLWKLFAKVFFFSALLFILLNSDKLVPVVEWLLPNKAAELQGSRLYDLASSSRALSLARGVVENNGVLKYEPLPEAKHPESAEGQRTEEQVQQQEDIVYDNDVTLDEDGTQQGEEAARSEGGGIWDWFGQFRR
jgi:hypothetical protein